MKTINLKRIISLMIVAVSLSLTVQAQTKPNIYILATGGTIAGQGASEVTSGYKAGAISVDQMLSAVPQIMDIANVKGEQVAQIGSQDMNNEVWLKLGKRVNELLSQPNVDAIVITHGTDTQEETAYFLNLVVKSEKPVVLVGSMRPSTAISADGPRNIYNAVACAIAKESIGKGVMVVMDDKILGADDLAKTNTLSVGTFMNPNYGPLGIVYNGKPIYTRESVKRHTTKSEFDITNLNELPRVEIVLSYSNATALFVDAAVKAGAKGIVTAGVGNGNLTTVMQNELAKARKNGVAVVRSSRIMTGPTAQWDEVDDDALSFVASWYINPYRSRVLLMLALTKTNDYKEIQRMFTEY
ncbi:L-asparaginase [Parabacteroides sp. PF5-5]|uniref:type II asparaginase n=1 Tax=unclassified Parabacteroides TaxID=2649774 RepID=UPI0024740CCC|nr:MULTISPECIES: type II asparaginase [unclassified Parabacteroides]MDH6303889.1 L-asparaginase [Parabacteroides sp. PH5-39]MDH6314506.1 L-asparaginase [Parabacteroides sp. PF5-13]MDH6318429.1 L-asparaginase [Parabacteroides sp. PH5-13]MDH6322278.1 L-asparaginase [Parabacteroides sp. PH5-8]MDH6325642.1 L-asparaginase [Parabacteroides sp. PH5-41]